MQENMVLKLNREEFFFNLEIYKFKNQLLNYPADYSYNQMYQNDTSNQFKKFTHNIST